MFLFCTRGCPECSGCEGSVGHPGELAEQEYGYAFTRQASEAKETYTPARPKSSRFSSNLVLRLDGLCRAMCERDLQRGHRRSIEPLGKDPAQRSPSHVLLAQKFFMLCPPVSPSFVLALFIFGVVFVHKGLS